MSNYNKSLLLPILVITSLVTIQPWQESKSGLIVDAFLIPHRASFTKINLKSSAGDEQAQILRDKADKIREEIAKLEGKSISQVQQEAQTKRDFEQNRLLQLEEKNKKRSEENEKRKSSSSGWNDGGKFLEVPGNHDEMVWQASRAIERAYKDGKTRQTVRFDLVGKNQMVGDENLWPGGTKEMYRESAKPLTNSLLELIDVPSITIPVSSNTTDEQPQQLQQQQARVPRTVKAQVLLDFDGTYLHTAETASDPGADVQALVFPNTDIKYIRDIEAISNAMESRLFILINPFWRNLDESWSFNLLQPGAKKEAKRVIFDNGYDDTYVALSFFARGEKCMAIKAYPYDWQLFAYLENNSYGGRETIIKLGSCKERPTSSVVTEMINDVPELKESKTMRQMKKIL